MPYIPVGVRFILNWQQALTLHAKLSTLFYVSSRCTDIVITLFHSVLLNLHCPIFVQVLGNQSAWTDSTRITTFMWDKQLTGRLSTTGCYMYRFYTFQVLIEMYSGSISVECEIGG